MVFEHVHEHFGIQGSCIPSGVVNSMKDKIPPMIYAIPMVSIIFHG